MAGKRSVNSPRLFYGDVVFLYCKTAGGYVFSEVSSTISASIAVDPVSSKNENDPDLGNVKMAAFKVLAADKLKAQQRLSDIRKTQLKEGKDTKELSTEEREILLSAKKNAEIEMHNNKAEQKRVAGTLVLYGNTVQLLHLFSGKYIAINPVETSKTEPDINVQVGLTNENTEHAFFRILPHYKVKSIGHKVYLHDQVKFEVVKSIGQYLHTSSRTYHDVGITLFGKCHEVNIANIPSGYTLKPHCRVILDDESENIIKAGSVIRLFHREIECYLVAEGSFANIKGKVMIEDVHLRKRKANNGKLRKPSTSAITYWQIEKDKPLSGDAIAWEENCRIKHLPTRMYLAVVKDENNSLKVTLKNRDLTEPDLDIVFKLLPIIEEDDEIKFESYVRINHPKTGSWLSAKKSAYVRQQYDSKATGLNALQWDTAEVKEIGVTSEMNYDDAFTIEEVADDLVQKFNHIAGVIPILKTYEVRTKMISILYTCIMPHIERSERPIDFEATVEALDVVIEFVKSAHADLIDRQKLLRNLMIVELVVQILKNHNPESSSDSPQHKVSRACYQVLEAYLKGKSGKNDIYLARFIPLFRKHIGLGINVENMLTELMRDNEEIVLGYELKDIDDIINDLLQKKDSRFMDILSALCVCNGRPIVEHQDYIVENLLLQHKQKLFYLTGVGKDVQIQTGSPNAIYFCKPEQNQWEPMPGRHHVGSKDLQFIIAQLNLFGMLCKGYNKKAINTIDKDLKYVTFNEALTGAEDTYLNFSLRSKYVELIIVLYVEANENNRALLENLPLSFNYSDIRENPYEEASKNPTVALTGAENEHFPELKDWIYRHVNSQQNVVGGKEIGSNIFNANVIDLLYLLVKYGYYANSNDINNLMPLLLSLLDGNNDRPSAQANEEEFRKVDRFKDTEENRPIFKLKIKVLKTMNLFFNFKFYLRLQKFVLYYKLTSGTQATHLLSSSHSFSVSQVTNGCNVLVEQENSPKDFSKRENKDLMDKFFSFTEYNYGATKSLPKILLDLANYENDEVLCESLHLLNTYYSSEDILFEKAIQTQLLDNADSKKVLYEVTIELLPALRRLALKDIVGEQFQDLINILKKLISLCHLKDAVHEPHHQNQKILYTTGVFSDIMSLMFRKEYKPKSPKLLDGVDKSQQEMIISTSLQFLKMLARNHKIVQERLFGSMDRLLDLKVAIPDVAELLTEVFTGVKEICLEIKERHIEKIFKLIVKPEYNGCPELLELLQAVVKAEDIDLPLKQNQTIVVKYFNLNREKFCDDFLGKDPKKEQKRESLLLHPDDSDYRLEVLLKVINLLAACCEGENPFIESLCQNVMSISELMKILNNNKIKPERKKPFVLFLLWVFINTGKNPAWTESIWLTHSSEMLRYLENVNILLNEIVRVTSNLPKAQVALMKMSCSYQLRRRTISRKVAADAGYNTESEKMIISHSNAPCVTNANDKLIPGVLIYVMEGALPMIKGYYTKLFDPYKPDQSVDQEEIIQVSANIASTLLCLADVMDLMAVNDCSSSQEQWSRTLCNTIITIISHNKRMIDVNIDIKIKFDTYMQARFNQHVDSKDTGQSNLTKEDLNENFNKFVQNFQRAYWGPNTPQHQINSPYNKEYSECVDLQQKGDNWLPLGSKYQKHVECFVCFSYSSCQQERFTCCSDQQGGETTVHDVTKRVIDYLLVSYNNFSHLTEKKQLLFRSHNIKYLQLLRTIIHNEIMYVDSRLKEQGQNPKEYRRQFERVRKVQGKIKDLGDGSTITKLVKLLSHPDRSISGQVLAFLTILLEGGNKKIQSSFVSYLLKTKEEKLFVSMQQRLEQATYNDNKRKELLAQLKHKRDEEQKLKELYTNYKVQYGFSKAPPPSVKLSSYTEEEFIGETSSKMNLIEKNDDMNTELQEPPKKDLSRPNTMTEQSLQPPTTLKREGIRIAEEEIMQQKEEEKIMQQKEKETMQQKEKETMQQKEEGKLVEKQTEHGKLASLKSRDTSHIKLTLKFLGLLCDGQNRTMQNYFREQPDNIETINLVSETCIFLQSFYVEVTDLEENIDLINELLQTLIEMCVGNFANQQVIYNHHIVDVVNRILQTTVFRQCSLEKVLELKFTAVKILEMLCEETSPLTKDLVEKVFKAVDIDALHALLAYFHGLSQDEYMKHLEKDDDAERATFTTYHILMHFADFQGISKEMIKPPSVTPKKRCKEDDPRALKRCKEVQRGWTFCENQSKSIEVSYKNDDGEVTLAKVHFRVPETNELSDEIKDKVKFKVDRTSPEDKIRDFSKWIESVKKEVKHLNYLRDHCYTNRFVKEMFCWRNQLLFLWTLLMNILMLIAWDNTLPKRHLNGTDIVVPTVPRQTENWFFSYVLYIGGGIHLLMSIAMATTYFLINGSNFVLPAFFYRVTGYFYRVTVYFYHDTGFFYKLFHRQHKPSYSDVPFFGLRTMYHIAFVIFSALSLHFYGYFYCVCLFHIVVDNDVLLRVLKSVTQNGKSLLWVAALGLIVIYNYAVGTFVFMPNEFNNQDEGEAVRYCDTLFECSVTVLEYGLLDTIGVTVDLPRNLRDATLRAILYDLSFFIIVTTIGLNIVFGIIVDAFSELRVERHRIKHDMKELCFICNIPSLEFERRTKGFNDHIKNEHNMWDYIKYIMYLEEIDINDHNAIEHYVHHQINRKDKNTEYFPLYQSRSLQEKKDDDLTELAELKRLTSVIVEHHQEEQRSTVIQRNKEDHAE